MWSNGPISKFGGPNFNHKKVLSWEIMRKTSIVQKKRKKENDQDENSKEMKLKRKLHIYKNYTLWLTLLKETSIKEKCKKLQKIVSHTHTKSGS